MARSVIAGRTFHCPKGGRYPPNIPRKHPCPVAGCPWSFAQKAQLRLHGDVHLSPEEKAARMLVCPTPGCTYASIREHNFEKHIAHCGTQPTKPPQARSVVKTRQPDEETGMKFIVITSWPPPKRVSAVANARAESAAQSNSATPSDINLRPPPSVAVGDALVARNALVSHSRSNSASPYDFEMADEPSPPAPVARALPDSQRGGSFIDEYFNLVDPLSLSVDTRLRSAIFPPSNAQTPTATATRRRRALSLSALLNPPNVDELQELMQLGNSFPLERAVNDRRTMR